MKTIEKKHALKWLRVGDLKAHPRVQRSKFSPARASRIAANLDPEKFGLLIVMVEGEDLWIIDGQHRHAALLMLGWQDQKIECLVYEGLTEVEAAKLFRSQSGRTAITALDDFLVALIEHDPDAVAINEIVIASGTSIGNGHGVSAVQALQRVYRPAGSKESQPEALHKTLSVITDAWGGTRESMQGSLIDGIGRVIVTYDGMINLSDLRRKLAKYAGGASGLIGTARGVREMFGGGLPDAIATIVVNEYNKQRRSQKLPDWRSGRKPLREKVSAS